MRILLHCNMRMDGSDFRWGLFTTLLRKHHIWHYTLGQDIIDPYNKMKPDLLISVKGCIPRNLKDRIKKDGCKTIQLFPDDLDLIERSLLLVPQFDYYFTNSGAALKVYHQNGFVNVKVCCFAVDQVLIKKAFKQSQYECDIIFAGDDNHKRYRYTYLNALKGLDLKVYGKWSKEVYGLTHKTLYGQDYFSALKSSKIGIDFSQSAAGFMNVKAKTFELTSAGCFVLANKFKEMENYFEYGKEIIGFESPEDLREKVEYYLKHEKERLKIAEAGHARFLKDHTWEKRIQFVFRECGL